MRFRCPKCKGVVSVGKEEVGKTVACGHCNEAVQVPPNRQYPGAIIGDFVIEKELNRGGMGIVYLAQQMSLERPVALKILLPKYADDAEFVSQFIREARAAAKLNHPNIVQAYAVGEDEGIFYFAMEFIDGETMKEELAREKKIPVMRAAKIIKDIAEALDFAWKERKIVHHDIKPDNIMMTKSGRAKLADLGLAQVSGEHSGSDDEEVLGTPQYISPEQLLGEPTDVRSDLYSLGASFYHLVTGKFPYVGDSANAIAHQHVNGELVPPIQHEPDLPPELNRIILKMMSRNIADRYQGADLLVRDLGAFIDNGGKTASTAMPVLKLNLPGKKAALPGVQAPANAPVAAATATPAAPAAATEAPQAPKLTLKRPGGDAPKDASSPSEEKKSEDAATVKNETGKKKTLLLALSGGIVLLLVGFAVLVFGFGIPKIPGLNQKSETPLEVSKPQPVTPTAVTPEVPVDPRKNYLPMVAELVKYRKEKPEDVNGFLSRVDLFLEDFPESVSDEERSASEAILKEYAVLDDIHRADGVRAESRRRHQQELEQRNQEEQRKIAEEKRRQEEDRRLAAERAEQQKIEKERQERLAEEKRRLDQRSNQYKAQIAKEYPILWQLFRTALSNENSLAKLKAMENEIPLKYPFPDDPTSMEIAALQDCLNMQKTLLKAYPETLKMYQMFHSPESEFIGLQFEIRTGELVRIIGILSAQKELQVRSLLERKDYTVSLEDENIRAMVFRFAERKNKLDNLEFFYQLFLGKMTPALAAKAPDAFWKKYAMEFAK